MKNHPIKWSGIVLLTIFQLSLFAQTGPTGPTGATGATGTPNWQGPWNSSTNYNPGDAVFDQGSSYVCNSIDSGDEPYSSITGNWTLLAQQGAIGATGATAFLGAGAVTGNTTYWDGTQWVLNSSFLYNDGTNVGIGVASPQNNLDANGTFQSTNGNYALVNNNNLAGQGITGCGSAYFDDTTYDLYFGGIVNLGGSPTGLFGYNNLNNHNESDLRAGPQGVQLMYITDTSSNNGTLIGYNSSYTGVGEALQMNDENIALNYEDVTNTYFQTVDLTSNYGITLSTSNYGSGSSNFVNSIYLNNNSATNKGLSFTTSTSSVQNSFNLSVANGLVVTGKDALSTSTGFSVQDNSNNHLLDVNNDGSIITKGALQLPLGATAATGDILTTDQYGNVSWALPSSLGLLGPTGATGATGPLVTGTANQTLRYDGTASDWVASSFLLNSDNDVRIGVSDQFDGADLTVGGKGVFGGYSGQWLEAYTVAAVTGNYPSAVIQSVEQIYLGESFPNPLLLNPEGGDVGINNDDPHAQLDIIGNIKITDGSQSAGYVLTSDANGYASWHSIPVLNNSWSLTGNGSTTPGTGTGQNFIGTTDANDLVFATYNAERMRILADGDINISGYPNINVAAGFLNIGTVVTTGGTPGITASGHITIYNKDGDDSHGIISEGSTAFEKAFTAIYNPNGTTTAEGFVVFANGQVEIGDPLSSSSNYNFTTGSTPASMSVGGIIVAQKMIVLDASNWADYVFNKDYDLKPLNEVEQYVKKNKHLPDVPSEKEIKANGGVDLGNMNITLLKKVEELTLYMIQQNKRIEKLEKENETLKANK